MISNSLVILALFILLTVVQIVLILIYKSIFKNSKDEYVINLSVLERVIDDYVNTILSKKIQQDKKNYNLDPESKLNSVLSFEKKVNEQISEASIDILKILSPEVSKSLSKKFSRKALALLVINKIKQMLI